MRSEQLPVLSTRALNRALLARQGLLEPWDCSPLQVVQRLAGLQAQAPLAPYYGVRSRLGHYDPGELGRALTGRSLVRLSLMRSTLQLVSGPDALAFRSVLARQLVRALPLPLRESAVYTEVIGYARELIEQAPRTFAELGQQLRERFPQHRADDLNRMARGGLALVQVPPRGLWGQSGPSRHTLLQTWLGAELPEPDPAEFIRRYLAAFGPAGPADVTAWSGLTEVRSQLDGMNLLRFRTEQGQPLYDLPDAPRPDADTPVPVRLLAEFDNILLGHRDRSRIFDDAHRLRFMSQNGLIAATVLIDGFVAGHCRLDRARAVATIQPYHRLAGGLRRAIVAEAEQLLAFGGPDRVGRVSIEPV